MWLSDLFCVSVFLSASVYVSLYRRQMNEEQCLTTRTANNEYPYLQSEEATFNINLNRCVNSFLTSVDISVKIGHETNNL